MPYNEELYRRVVGYYDVFQSQALYQYNLLIAAIDQQQKSEESKMNVDLLYSHEGQIVGSKTLEFKTKRGKTTQLPMDYVIYGAGVVMRSSDGKFVMGPKINRYPALKNGEVLRGVPLWAFFELYNNNFSLHRFYVDGVPMISDNSRVDGARVDYGELEKLKIEPGSRAAKILDFHLRTTTLRKNLGEYQSAYLASVEDEKIKALDQDGKSAATGVWSARTASTDFVKKINNLVKADALYGPAIK